VWSYNRGKVFLHENIAVPPMPVELERFLAWVCQRWDAEDSNPKVREARLIKVVREPPGSEAQDGVRPVSYTEQIALLRRDRPKSGRERPSPVRP
jgi:hypothetical protein